MPFIPHNDEDLRAMLEAIGAGAVQDLFDEIPSHLQSGAPPALPPALGEMEVARLMGARAQADGNWLSFIGAGAYEHHIPAAVWQIAARGEFYSSYTPYQPEASQGTLQVIWEYQSMMAALTGLEVSNASLYEGASALAEAVLMAVRAHASSRRVLVPATTSPLAVRAVRTLVANQGIELVSVPFDPATGTTHAAALPEGDWAALVVQQPNFFGMLEPVHALAERAQALGARVIAFVNPVSLAVLEAPGRWGSKGADVAVGDGQPLGAPLSGGGPYFGFMCCRKDVLRQMPGRLVGRTVDRDGRPGFVLTLQAREQHIRRGKATSNICTNQGLMATAAAIHMALLGPRGLAAVASRCHAGTLELVELLTRIPGVERAFDGVLFHEAVLRLPTAAEPVLRALRAQGILGGLDMAGPYPELGPALLVCATETKTRADLERYAEQLERILSRRREGPPCSIR